MAEEMAVKTNQNLTKERVLKYREVYARYGKKNGGKIAPQNLGRVMRFLGKNPSEAELRDMVEKVDADRKGTIEFHDFLNMMQTKKDYSDCENEINEAFRVFDKEGNGLVSVAELKDALKSQGEKLTEEEVEELFKFGETDDIGFIKYQDICTAVLQ